MIKEVGDPMAIADYLGLNRQNCRHDHSLGGTPEYQLCINIYACHPFFIQGIATMTNGENTAFVPIREYLMSRNYPGYVGYQSDRKFSPISSTIAAAIWT